MSKRHAMSHTGAVVLVGHSLGGLVLMKLAVDANRLAHQEGQVDSAFQARCQAFCNNLAGVFSYATPPCRGLPKEPGKGRVWECGEAGALVGIPDSVQS